MATVDPSYRPHSILENNVTQYLESLGYTVDSAPYHEKMSDQVVKALQNIYTPTGLYLRGRADRIAIKSSPPIVFEWEAKTHKSRTRHDCLIEAMPLCFHIAHSKLDVRCLYVYCNPFKDHNFGFWVQQMPPIRVIMIPNRWNEEQTCYFKKIFESMLPGIKVVLTQRTQGSDDPFLIIDESEMVRLPHWKDLIKETASLLMEDKESK